MASTLPRLPVFEAISGHDPESTVVVHSASQRTFRYGELLGDVCRMRNRLLEASGRDDIHGERIAFLVENSYDYVGKLEEEPGNPAVHHCFIVLLERALNMFRSHMAGRPGSKGNSRALVAGFPSTRAAIHPGAQRGLASSLLGEVHNQGGGDPRPAPGVAAEARGDPQASGRLTP